MSKYQDLLGCVDVLMYGENDLYTILPGWEDLPRPNVKLVTDQAAMLECDTIPETWIPLSLLRCDTEGNLHLVNWKYEELAQ